MLSKTPSSTKIETGSTKSTDDRKYQIFPLYSEVKEWNRVQGIRTDPESIWPNSFASGHLTTYPQSTDNAHQSPMFPVERINEWVRWTNGWDTRSLSSGSLCLLLFRNTWMSDNIHREDETHFIKCVWKLENRTCDFLIKVNKV